MKATRLALLLVANTVRSPGRIEPLRDMPHAGI
jgi:hypothetical protein